MSEYDSKSDTLEHIARVQKNLGKLIRDLSERQDHHDASKLRSPEKETFDRVTPLLRDLTYGSDEYKAVLENMQEALDHHYAKNRHHPEHFKGKEAAGEVYGKGIRGMTLVDLVEMFCDWCAATERHDDGDIRKSISVNMERFGYDETLAEIFINTAHQYRIGKMEIKYK